MEGEISKWAKWAMRRLNRYGVRNIPLDELVSVGYLFIENEKWRYDSSKGTRSVFLNRVLRTRFTNFVRDTVRRQHKEVLPVEELPEVAHNGFEDVDFREFLTDVGRQLTPFAQVVMRELAFPSSRTCHLAIVQYRKTQHVARQRRMYRTESVELTPYVVARSLDVSVGMVRSAIEEITGVLFALYPNMRRS